MTKPRKGSGGRYVCDVDSSEYEFSRWGAEKSLDVLAELSDLVGKPLGLVLGGITNKQGLQTRITGDLAQTVIGALTRKLRKNKADVLRVLKLLCVEEVFCDGKAIRNLDHYEGRLDHLFRVAYAGLEVQYGSFFAAVRDAVGLRPDTAESLTQASATSTG